MEKKHRLHFILPDTILHKDCELFFPRQGFMFNELAKHFELTIHSHCKDVSGNTQQYDKLNTNIKSEALFDSIKTFDFLKRILYYRKKLLALPDEDFFFFAYPMGLIGILSLFIMRRKKCIVWVRSDTAAVHRSIYMRFYNGIIIGLIRTIVNPIKNLLYYIISYYSFKENVIFYTSNITLNKLNHINQYEIISVPNLQNLPETRSAYPAHKLCFVGNETPRKGLLVLLKALHATNHKDDLELHIVGIEQLSDPKLVAASKDLNIVFHGQTYNRTQVYKIISESDALVMPSFAEKQGKVQLEAMAVGTVPICSDSGGTYRTISNYHNGLLFKTGNSEMLAKSINVIYQAPNLFESMQKNGADFALSLNLSKQFKFMAETSKKYYDSVEIIANCS